MNDLTKLGKLKDNIDIINKISNQLLNICQNIALFEWAKKDVINKFNLLINECKTNFGDYEKKNIYSYSLEYAMDYFKEALELVKDSSIKCNELYTLSVKAHTYLNVLMDIINLQNMSKSIGLAYDPANFSANQTSEYKDVWNRPISQSVRLPSNLSEYKVAIRLNEVDITDEPSVKAMKQLVIEQFVYQVHATNFSSFHNNNNNNNNNADTKPVTGYIVANPHTDTIQLKKPGNGFGRDKDQELTLNRTVGTDVLTPYVDTAPGKYGEIAKINPTDKDKFIMYNLNNHFDTYINYIKYEIIKYIVQKTNTDIGGNIPKDVFDNIKSLYNDDAQAKSIVFTMAAKLADQLIINHINFCIQQGALKIMKKIAEKNNDDINAYFDKQTADTVQLHKLDIGFKLNLNETSDELLKYFESNPTKNPHITSKPVQGTFDNNTADQVTLYDTNYTKITLVKKYNCYKVNDDVIENLIKYGANVNTKNIAGMTPILYAIQQLNIKYIKLLLNKGTHLATSSGSLTPLSYAIKLFRTNSGFFSDTITVKDRVDYLCKPMIKSVKNEILENEDYRNNIVKYYDICYGQFIIMLNTHLFGYIVNNTKDDIDERDKFCDTYNNKLGITCTNIYKQFLIDDMKTDIIIDNTVDKKIANIDKRILSAHASIKFYDITTTIPNSAVKNIYKKIFTDVINYKAGGGYTGKEYYLEYCQMWNIYLEKGELNNIYNFQLALSQKFNELCDDPVGNKDKIEIIKETYESTIYNFLETYFDPTKDHIDIAKNNSLAVSFHIIVHIVRHVIAANMYITLIKTITEYLLELNTYETDKDTGKLKNAGDKYIFDIMDTFVDNATLKLAEYIIGHMPRKIVKHILEIKSSDFDDLSEIKSVTDLFKPIIDIISSNTIIDTSQNTTLIKNIETYIFPFYEEMFKLTTMRLKALSDNYCRQMMNEYRYIEIVNMIVNK